MKINAFFLNFNNKPLHFYLHKNHFFGNFAPQISQKNNRTVMAIAIKSIPVLTGQAAERFVEMAEASGNEQTTVIPQSMQASIMKMMERSRHITIKRPQAR